MLSLFKYLYDQLVSSSNKREEELKKKLEEAKENQRQLYANQNGKGKMILNIEKGNNENDDWLTNVPEFANDKDKGSPNRKFIRISNNITRCNKDISKNTNVSESGSGCGLQCFEDVGIVTDLKANYGFINKTIQFDIDNTDKCFTSLRIGWKVKYLAYLIDGNENNIKLVKITELLDSNWDRDGEVISNEELDELIENLNKSEEHHRIYYDTHERTMNGVISNKSENLYINIDNVFYKADYKECDENYKPEKGDKVFITCIVQSDQKYVDRCGCIILLKRIYPSRIYSEKQFYVVYVDENWGELSENTYYKNDILDNDMILNKNDAVLVDIIECQIGKYEYRAIKLNKIEKTCYTVDCHNDENIQNDNDNQENNFVHVSITKILYCVFSSLYQTKTIDIKLKNNRNKILHCNSIIINSKNSKSQLYLDDEDFQPNGFNMQANEERIIKVEIKALIMGVSVESLIFNFEHFTVKRVIRIVVCNSEEEVQNAIEKFEIKPLCDTTNNNNTNNNSSSNNSNPTALYSNLHNNRFYANKVWNAAGTANIRPGVGFAPKRRFQANQIDSYKVPSLLKEIYFISGTKNETAAELERNYPYLREDLSFKNYTKKFQTYLHLEEIECFLNFRKFDKNKAHFTRDGEYLVLEVEDLNEKRPSPSIGDIVRASNPWNCNSSTNEENCHDGIIHKVLNNRLCLKFNDAFQSRYNGEDYRIELHFSRFNLRKQHYATLKIMNHLGENFLFPETIKLNNKPQLNANLDSNHNLLIDNQMKPWFNPLLNSIQKEAICRILRGEIFNMPYIIFGPPGTGKTITIVETILQIAKNCRNARILVGTPSNSSANLIATRLIDSGLMKPGDFIRLVSLNLVENDSIPEHLCPYSATIDTGMENSCANNTIKTNSGLTLKCQMSCIGTHPITISTCSTLGNLHLMKFSPNHFTHIVIDEAGQCTEPEIMVPITLIKPKNAHIILAGDPQQLQAITINRYSPLRGNPESFLERIHNSPLYQKNDLCFAKTSGYDPLLITKLIYNYRAIPSILKIYNHLFYNSELIAKIDAITSNEAKLLNSLQEILSESSKNYPNNNHSIKSNDDDENSNDKGHCGVYFYGLVGESLQQNDSPSWYNPLEAKHVFLMVLKLYKLNIMPEQIGIITPYTKQVKHLRLIFKNAELDAPKIGSVEEFQGQERDIILISTVRSESKQLNIDFKYSLGFLQNPKRTNVAISRARCLNFIVGNPKLLAKDTYWHAIIQYCIDNGTYWGCNAGEDFLKLPSS